MEKAASDTVVIWLPLSSIELNNCRSAAGKSSAVIAPAMLLGGVVVASQKKCKPKCKAVYQHMEIGGNVQAKVLARRCTALHWANVATVYRQHMLNGVRAAILVVSASWKKKTPLPAETRYADTCTCCWSG